MSCGSFYNNDGIDKAANLRELTREVSEFDGPPAYLNLDWPSTVEFSSPEDVQDADTRDKLKQLENKLGEQRRPRQEQNPKSTVDSSSKPSDTCAHEESSSVAEAGKSFDPRAARQGQEKDPEGVSVRMESLIYRSLTGVDETRLLHLSPRESINNQILHGFLENTNLSIRPEDTAVSYTWSDAGGNRDLREVIFLGDLWTPLLITSNCAAALRRLRSGHVVQTLWVDSICINQSSTREKSHQVGLMRDIFSRASNVKIFLGDDEDTPDAHLLKETSESLFYNANQGDVVWSAIRDHVAVRALFDRPYWSRIWVIQEVLLSKRAIVLLGKTAVPLKSLLAARLAEPDGSEREFSVPPWLGLGKALPIEDFNGLSTLLTETSGCFATDPKDMIFALLGLVQGAHLEGLVADYSKSIYEIRVGIATYFLIHRGQTNILKSAAFGARERQDDRLLPGSPSWVPSWEKYPSDEPIFADVVDRRCWHDLYGSSHSSNWAGGMRCYKTLRPGEASNMCSDSSRSSGSPFRVVKGTGALLVEAYPMLRVDFAPFRGAFKYRDVARKSAVFTPSTSPVRWGIYATRQWADKPFVFGLPGDWIVEIPGCEDFFLLRQIPSVPGTYRISSVCGLAIAVAWAGEWMTDDQLPLSTDGSVRVHTRHENDDLVSRLVVFNRHQLHFLEGWALLMRSHTTLGPSSETTDSATDGLSHSLSAEDMAKYTQWADRIESDPMVAMQPTDFEDSLKNVSAYLDRWQSLELWDRIVSELKAVPWASLLETMTEVRRGIRAYQTLEGQTTGELHDVRKSTLKLGDLLELTGSLPLQSAGIMGVFRPLFEVLDETDIPNVRKVFETIEDEIERNLIELESILEFMRDSLLVCDAIRDQFSQRQVLRQLYGRSELRKFVIY